MKCGGSYTAEIIIAHVQWAPYVSESSVLCPAERISWKPCLQTYVHTQTYTQTGSWKDLLLHPFRRMGFWGCPEHKKTKFKFSPRLADIFSHFPISVYAEFPLFPVPISTEGPFMSNVLNNSYTPQFLLLLCRFSWILLNRVNYLPLQTCLFFPCS